MTNGLCPKRFQARFPYASQGDIQARAHDDAALLSYLAQAHHLTIMETREHLAEMHSHE